jgi:hypothetical protein
MPSSSLKQHRFFQAVEHGFKPDGRKAPSVAVAKEFTGADKAAGKYQKKSKSALRRA